MDLFESCYLDETHTHMDLSETYTQACVGFDSIMGNESNQSNILKSLN